MRRSAAWSGPTAVVALFTLAAHGPGLAQTTTTQVDEALQNITSLVRTGKVGYATFWDGNKYIQCRRLPNGELRCEAAGSAMQPTLKRVLIPERLSRLAALGWVLNPNFGNYVRTFAADVPTQRIAEHILQTLHEAYDANVPGLEVQTTWVADVPCPPRAGPTQNLAGSVNDAPSMRLTAVRACFYTPEPDTAQIANSAAELIGIYGTRVAAEIQRLRLNSNRRVYVSFNAGIGYIQCAPETAPSAIYCEAQSTESWPALAAVLTPERVARLRNAGYADPGRAPNYSRSYAPDRFNDTAVAREILTILYDVYGYFGASPLKFKTEQ